MRMAFRIFGVIVLLTFIAYVFGSIGQAQIKKTAINQVDLTKLEDGVYKGQFSKARWSYEVEVTIKDHHISAIKSTNKLPRPAQKLADEAICTMLEKQSVQIDAISGASINTRAFQKAVENALTK